MKNTLKITAALLTLALLTTTVALADSDRFFDQTGRGVKILELPNGALVALHYEDLDGDGQFSSQKELLFTVVLRGPTR